MMKEQKPASSPPGPIFSAIRSGHGIFPSSGGPEMTGQVSTPDVRSNRWIRRAFIGRRRYMGTKGGWSVRSRFLPSSAATEENRLLCEDSAQSRVPNIAKAVQTASGKAFAEDDQQHRRHEGRRWPTSAHARHRE